MATVRKCLFAGLIGLLLMQQTNADDFALPSASEFGETSIDTLGLRNAASGKAVDVTGREEIEPLGSYPLLRQELGLIFDAALAEKAARYGFMERPSLAGALGPRTSADDGNDWADLSLRATESDPMKALSLMPDEGPESGIHVGVDPYYEEVSLNWFVGF